MKVRTGFVSNSSSSSFAIPKSALSEFQIYLIKHHIHAANNLPGLGQAYAKDDDAWRIEEEETKLIGYTIMDNFDMREFLSKIGVIMNFVEWGDYCGDWYDNDE